MEALLAIALLVLVAIAVVVATRRREPPETTLRTPGPGEKKCRFCSEPIPEEARTCPHCKRDVSLQTMT